MSSKIGAVLLSYDVNSKHLEIKKEMKKLGYRENWNYTNEPTYSLPNTTLWHSNKTTDTAISDIKGVCTRLGVTLEKAVAVLATDFAGYKQPSR